MANPQSKAGKITNHIIETGGGITEDTQQQGDKTIGRTETKYECQFEAVEQEGVRSGADRRVQEPEGS